jgi:hypothetical protein
MDDTYGKSGSIGRSFRSVQFCSIHQNVDRQHVWMLTMQQQNAKARLREDGLFDICVD